MIMVVTCNVSDGVKSFKVVRFDMKCLYVKCLCTVMTVLTLLDKIVC